MKPTLVVLLSGFPVLFCAAQDRSRAALVPYAAPQDTVPPKITMTRAEGGAVQFSAQLRPLRPVVGAPLPFYTYFWEFGDGTFSDVTLNEGKNPRHLYKASGTYRVRLFATNNYDYGLAPPSKPQLFSVQAGSPANARWASNFFSPGDRDVKIKVNHSPKPGEELVAYIGYRNRLGEDFAGSLVLFFNESKFYQKSFVLADKRTYHGEEGSSLDRVLSYRPDPETANRAMLAGTAGYGHNPPAVGTALSGPLPAEGYPESPSGYLNETQALVRTLKREYRENAAMRFAGFPKNEERFVFFTLKTLPELIRDTNDVIKMTALLVPDDPALPPQKFELAIPIVVSHDPNQMVLRQNRINYRFMGKNKELTYTVRFQNTGNGAAKNIAIAVPLPKQLNAASLQINEVSPKLIACDSVEYGYQSCVSTVKTGDSIYVLLKNIYLPGLKQNGVRNEDSTKGFVEYSIRFKKRPKKIPFSSRAVITFDNTRPVYTNNATAKFIKGISPGIMAGYNLSLANGNYAASGPLQIGYVLAPFSPYRPYFQAELHASILEKEDSTGTSLLKSKTWQIPKEYRPPPFNRFSFDSNASRKEATLSRKRNWVQLVPLHFRYNVNNWLGAGVGMLGQIAVSEQSTLTEKYYITGSGYNPLAQAQQQKDTVITRAGTTSTRMWTEFNLAPFFDLQVGRVRTGPTLGLRYLRRLKGNIPNRFFVYAAFKL